MHPVVASSTKHHERLSRSAASSAGGVSPMAATSSGVYSASNRAAICRPRAGQGGYRDVRGLANSSRAGALPPTEPQSACMGGSSSALHTWDKMLEHGSRQLQRQLYGLGLAHDDYPPRWRVRRCQAGGASHCTPVQHCTPCPAPPPTCPCASATFDLMGLNKMAWVAGLGRYSRMAATASGRAVPSACRTRPTSSATRSGAAKACGARGAEQRELHWRTAAPKQVL